MTVCIIFIRILNHLKHIVYKQYGNITLVRNRITLVLRVLACVHCFDDMIKWLYFAYDMNVCNNFFPASFMYLFIKELPGSQPLWLRFCLSPITM